MTPAHIAARTRWAVRMGFDPGGDAMAEALLLGLARAGICLDTSPRDEHLRLNTRDGWARIFGMLVLSGAGEGL